MAYAIKRKVIFTFISYGYSLMTAPIPLGDAIFTIELKSSYDSGMIEKRLKLIHPFSGAMHGEVEFANLCLDFLPLVRLYIIVYLFYMMMKTILRR